MKSERRFGLSAEQKSEVWRRWKAGQTLHEIGRAFGKPHTSIHCLLAHHDCKPHRKTQELLASVLRNLGLL
jgi:hypothetical protein